ncbi:hypothetical protein [Streptomyces yaizuensis]|uniref:Secreted protein n=1 Tax=Streptomyces yaizuensis TaxID=2989713 RepID=A0ABQ5NUP4_9ACTN|nr:hypothetical protein [Streptomyces sp. YSPA8]GLF94091.1 hypothetical protein SYYSPA8_07360 [Streptomyces sp. YSPA8]
MKSARSSPGAVMTVLAMLGLSLAAAPSASATTHGCGDLSNGLLCNTGGTLGRSGTYTFTTKYHRFRGGEVTVKLGTQRKNSRITALPLWFGSQRTANGHASLSRSHPLDADNCVRGVMEHDDTMYVTKWRCP